VKQSIALLRDNIPYTIYENIFCVQNKRNGVTSHENTTFAAAPLARSSKALYLRMI
jgi:hypothetical protein